MLNSRICNIRDAKGAFTTNVFFELFDLKHTFIFFLLGDAHYSIMHTNLVLEYPLLLILLRQRALSIYIVCIYRQLNDKGQLPLTLYE